MRLALVNNTNGVEGEVPDPLHMLGLEEDEAKVAAINIWYNTIVRLVGGELVEEEEEEEGGELADAAVTKDKRKFKMTPKSYYLATGKPTFAMPLDVSLFEDNPQDAVQLAAAQDLARPFLGATCAAPKGFVNVGQLMTTAPLATLSGQFFFFVCFLSEQ